LITNYLNISSAKIQKKSNIVSLFSKKMFIFARKTELSDKSNNKQPYF